MTSLLLYLCKHFCEQIKKNKAFIISPSLIIPGQEKPDLPGRHVMCKQSRENISGHSRTWPF